MTSSNLRRFTGIECSLLNLTWILSLSSGLAVSYIHSRVTEHSSSKYVSASMPHAVSAVATSCDKSVGGVQTSTKCWQSVHLETSTYTWPIANTPSKQPI